MKDKPKISLLVLLIALLVHMLSCNKGVEPIELLTIDTYSCIKQFNTTVCPDSNLFYISVKGRVQGDVGTLLIIQNSFADSVIMECENWVQYIPEDQNQQYTIFERTLQSSEKVNFEYIGYRSGQCMDANSFFTDDQISLIYTSSFDEFGHPNIVIFNPPSSIMYSASCR